MLRPPNGQRRIAGRNFVRENTVKSIRTMGGARNGWMGIPGRVFAKGMAQARLDSLTGELPYGPVV